MEVNGKESVMRFWYIFGLGNWVGGNIIRWNWDFKKGVSWFGKKIMNFMCVKFEIFVEYFGGDI